ncbi:CAF17-like 4Fe-4S cluster assembly/insertion protein YgfZ [Pseudotabrizicola sp. L79]|uniref:CAF17-like 4Fe-4S cluster assembly/insertion protein YgfZ n=1 Tax=Pseudotabrizicola sp. L79 TaxID=3118402 RepID=UPI002F92BBAD
MTGETATDRVVWRVTGADRFTFLQGLVSNDVLPLAKAPGIRWAALLTPQGKYLADFFVIRRADSDDLLIDIAAPLAADTLKRLGLYRLRADVQITPCDLPVTRGLGPCPAQGFDDPRHPALGWRGYGLAPDVAGGPPLIDWDAIRVAHAIPESGIELVPNDTYLLEAGFERLHGVDFRKGCYVGQEVTARMKHKTELRKGLITLGIAGSAPPGTVIAADGKDAGVLFTQSNGLALAHLRFDRLAAPLTAGDARLWALPEAQ